jgi:S1-C subfamily serine protease
VSQQLSGDLSKFSKLESLILEAYSLVDYAREQFPKAPLAVGHHGNHVENNQDFRNRRDTLSNEIRNLLVDRWDMLTYHRFQAARDRFERSVPAGGSPVVGNRMCCRCWWDARDQLLASADFLDGLRMAKSVSDIHRDWILSNTFVLESGLGQGTCFNLEDAGLVTCAHVLPKDNSDLVVFRATDTGRKFTAKASAQELAIDLASLDVPDLQLGIGLSLGSASGMVAGEKVYLAGFPNYRMGDTGIITEGSITGFRIISTIKRLLVSAHIVRGNSGGPVLNSLGQVIGVALTGADRMEDIDETEHHSVVPIDALRALRL